MDRNSNLTQDIQASIAYCRRELKSLSVTSRPDVLDAIAQTPEYLQWMANHGLRHAQMQLADVLVKTYTLIGNEIDRLDTDNFQDILEELVKDKAHRTQLISAAGYQRLQFLIALRHSMALPLNHVHSFEELRDAASAVHMVVTHMLEELNVTLTLLKPVEIDL